MLKSEKFYSAEDVCKFCSEYIIKVIAITECNGRYTLFYE